MTATAVIPVDRKAGWCEAHHVVPWEHGGETSLANLVLKCSRHHHIGHRPGWSEKLKPDGELVLADPLGRTFSSRPPGVLRADQRAARRPRPQPSQSVRRPT